MNFYLINLLDNVKSLRIFKKVDAKIYDGNENNLKVIDIIS